MFKAPLCEHFENLFICYMMVINVVAVLPKACLKRPCHNGGTCHGDDSDYYCECTKDYIGVDCEGKYVIYL